MTEDQRNKIMKIARLVAVLVVIAVGLYGYISQNKKKEDAVNTPSSDAVSITEITTEEETTTEPVANTTTETTTEQSAENTTTRNQVRGKQSVCFLLAVTLEQVFPTYLLDRLNIA